VIRPAEEADCDGLAPHLRDDDRKELLAAYPQESEAAALRLCLLNSAENWTIESWGKPVGLFGITRVPIGDIMFGVVWCLGSNAMLHNRAAFIRQSRLWLRCISQGCALTGNMVSSTNKLHRRWLKWLGYSFLREVELGGLTFVEFVRIEETYVSSIDHFDDHLHGSERDRNGSLSASAGDECRSSRQVAEAEVCREQTDR